MRNLTIVPQSGNYYFKMLNTLAIMRVKNEDIFVALSPLGLQPAIKVEHS